MNSLFSIYIEWKQDKPKEMLGELISFGMKQQNAMIVGKGEARFYLYINQLKRDMNTEQLLRFREELQRDMSSLENRKLATDDIRNFFVGRVGDIERAIRKAIHLYEKTRNANPLKAHKDGLQEKRNLDNQIEKHLRKKAF